LSRLAERPPGPSLALFDLAMPGMEGPNTLAAVRKDHPDTRIAVVSASQSRDDVVAALAAGVHGYIAKGSGPLELIRALKIVMSGDIYVPAFLADVPANGMRRAESSTILTASEAEEKALGTGLAVGSAETRGSLVAISPRQREVLALLVKGYSNKRIAQELLLGEGTVKIHVAGLLRNLGVSNRAGAAAAGALLLQN
jgi:DNA-binding NarL/FixJ family response regulator